ncbi:hypothetical protein [Calothrix sp. NIES-2100]
MQQGEVKAIANSIDCVSFGVRHEVMRSQTLDDITSFSFDN